jgi:hypothetical protein
VTVTIINTGGTVNLGSSSDQDCRHRTLAEAESGIGFWKLREALRADGLDYSIARLSELTGYPEGRIRNALRLAGAEPAIQDRSSCSLASRLAA